LIRYQPAWSIGESAFPLSVTRVKLDLRHLEVVIAVADAGSISRAAAAMKIAQPGLTAQLRRIEHRVGGPLFVRRPDGVVPTELGEHVITGARDLVDRLRRLLASSYTLARHVDPVAPVRLGGVCGRLVALLATTVHYALPGRGQTTLVESRTDPVVTALAAGALDLAVLSDVPDAALHLPPEIEARPVGTEQTLIGLATGHPLAARAYLDLADLADEDWALPPDPVGADHRGFRSACAAAGFTPRCRQRLGDATATADLVRAGYAVSPFPPVAEPAGVALRPLRGNPLPRRHLLVWLRDGTSVSADDVHRELVHRFAAITRHPADPVRLTAVA